MVIIAIIYDLPSYPVPAKLRVKRKKYRYANYTKQLLKRKIVFVEQYFNFLRNGIFYFSLSYLKEQSQHKTEKKYFPTSVTITTSV